MKAGSIGEIPPSTRRNRGFSALTASAARLTIEAKLRHSGSSSKFQCERLLGSFQSITASITMTPPVADVHFVFRMARDVEARAAQHGLAAGLVRNPPIGRVVRVLLLHEVHCRVARILKDGGLGKIVVGGKRQN